MQMHKQCSLKLIRRLLRLGTRQTLRRLIKPSSQSTQQGKFAGIALCFKPPLALRQEDAHFLQENRLQPKGGVRLTQKKRK